MPREASKCRKWERDRRDRLKSNFTALSKLLPCYDPSLPLTNIEVLQKATAYIEELKLKNKKLLTVDGIKRTDLEELKRLHERVKKLLIRNEQLCNLLKDAGIKIPTVCGTVKKFIGSLRWSHKVSADQAKILVQRATQKENEPKKVRTKSLKSRMKAKQRVITAVAPKHRKSVSGKLETKKINLSRKKVKLPPASISSSTSLTLLHTAGVASVPTPSCFIITNAPSNNLPPSHVVRTRTTVVTNSGLLSTPITASSIKQNSISTVTTKPNTPLSSLGPGTLILSNGNIVPVLPPPTALLPNPTIFSKSAQILVNPPTKNTTLIVVPTSVKETRTNATVNNLPVSKTVTTSKFPAKTLPMLKPKIDLTRTTQVNKVPIPAHTSQYAANYLVPSTIKQNLSFSKKPLYSKIKHKRSTSKGEHSKSVKKDENNTNEQKANTNNMKSLLSPAKKRINSSVVCKSKNKIPKLDEPEGKKVNLNLTESPDGAIDNSKKPLVAVTSSYSIDSLCKENINSRKQNDTLKSDMNKENSSHNSLKDFSQTNNNSKPEIETLEAPALEKNGNKEANIVYPEVKIVKDSSVNESKEKSSPSTTSEVIKEKQTDNDEILNIEMPSHKNIDIDENLPHSELSDDIFASLQVPTGGQNPESTSPTAAFLLAFPLVSTLTGVKVTEVIEENSDSQRGTPTLLQIGTMDTTKPTQSQSESLTPSLLNLDNFSFFTVKECGSFYPPFDSVINTSNTSVSAPSIVTASCISSTKAVLNTSIPATELNVPKDVKIIYEESVAVTKTQNLGNKLKDNVYPAASSDGKELQLSHNATAPASSSVHQNSVDLKLSNSKQDLFASRVTKISQNTLFSTPTSVPVPKTTEISSGIYNSYPNKSAYGNVEVTVSNKPAVTSTMFPSKSKNSGQKATYSNHYGVENSDTYSTCNTFNPFTDFTKCNTMLPQTYTTKSYSDPVYTNSTKYSYMCHGENNFGSHGYSGSKSLNKNGGSNRGNASSNYSTYPDFINSENKKHTTQVHYNNYYNQAQAQSKEKTNNYPPKGTKALNYQPRPPVNWMTTPDIRQPPPTTDYLTNPLAKDFDITGNSVYQPNTFVTNSQTYFNTNSAMYPTCSDFQNTFGEHRKALEPFPVLPSNSFQRNDVEENQFSWSPTKLPQFLDTPHNFISSNLPTLIGDLALSTTQPSYVEHKMDNNKDGKQMCRTKDANRHGKPQSINVDTNFLSVSQLVDHNKSESVPARQVNRRNSGNRIMKTSTPQKPNKRTHKTRENKDSSEIVGHNYVPQLESESLKSDVIKHKQSFPQNINYNAQGNIDNTEWINNPNKPHLNLKQPPSSYSAEALIGHHNQSDNFTSKSKYPQSINCSTSKTLPVPSFLTDNIIPYFPPVDLQQDNTFPQQNQNYQNTSFSHNFPTSLQSNGYSTSTFMPNASTNYLSSSALIPELGTHEYNSIISDNLSLFSHATNRVGDNKTFNKNSNMKTDNISNRAEDKNNVLQTNNCSVTNNFTKKAKRRHYNENNLPGIVDFSFLSMPGTINSPILPDDFHSHTNFLPPPAPSQLYPCKKPLYPKQNTDLSSATLLPPPPPPPPPVSISRNNIVQYSETSCISSAGTSLTNFNLSTIFPEINKGLPHSSGIYTESTRNKVYSSQKNYITNNSNTQAAFNNKSVFTSSYINTATTNSFTNS